MKKLTLQIFTVGFALSLMMSCQKKENLSETFNRINGEVLQNSRAYATLREATSTIGHRLTGSDHGHQAEEYTYNKFKEYGFDDVKFQEFEPQKGLFFLRIIQMTACASSMIGSTPSGPRTP